MDVEILATLIGDEIDKICEKFDIDYEKFIDMQAVLADRDAEKQEHPLVKSVLESMAENLREASFNFYASFK